MQTRSPVVRHLHGGSDQNSDLSSDWGNISPSVPGFDDYVFSIPSSSHNSSGPKGGTDGSVGTVSSAASGSTSQFVININWDASVSGAPAGFTAGVMKAVQFLETQFSNPVTITIDVGYGEVNGRNLSGNALGESVINPSTVSYAALMGALQAHATTAADQSAVATLPSSSPVGGTFWASPADEKALGLMSGSSVDGYVGFSSSASFTYDDSSGVAGGTYDFYGTVLHEITEVMGRLMLDGGSTGGISNSYYPLDLYHYSSAGVRDFSFSTPGYLSTDGGATDGGDLNTVSGGDPGDWASSMGNDSFDAFANSGVVNGFSADDLTTMSLLGWEPTVACYVRGTRIAVPAGEVAVEALRIGDVVLTARGETKRIRWIGRRSYTAEFVTAHPKARPICVRRNAIARGLPRRDLFISPEHALLIDGVLVPARHLVNGSSIVIGDEGPVHYVHIELAEHDAILAEGQAAESFVDCESRAMFENAAEFNLLYPHDSSPKWAFCAQRVEDGEVLADIRHRLHVRAGLAEGDWRDGTPGPLIGHLESATGNFVEGWAQDSSAPERPVRLEVLADGVLIGRVVANRYRIDLAAAGLGSGRHAFRLPFGGPALHIEARRLGDGTVLGIL